jgi:hypothetical protein
VFDPCFNIFFKVVEIKVSIDFPQCFIYRLPFKTAVDVPKSLRGNGSANIDSKFIFGVVLQIYIMTFFFLVINELWIQIIKEGTAGQTIVTLFKIGIVKSFFIWL